MQKYPLITIALAIYKPRLDWFELQLKSLNEQDYPNLELLVWNDCPDEDMPSKIIEQYITKFPYKLYQGKKNLGSNGAFGELTKRANGEYIAYCDQDDEWLSNKLSEMYVAMQENKADLVCCDMYVMDGENNTIANSILDIRPNQIFYEGRNLFRYLIRKNFITGCASLVSTNIAKKAFPIPQGFYHDWWIGLYVAANGKIVSLKKSLLIYRIHGNNQTGALNFLKNKKEYYNLCIFKEYLRSEALVSFYKQSSYIDCVREFYEFMNLRKKYFWKPNAQKALRLFCYLYKYNSGKKGLLFEIAMPLMTESIFKFLISFFWKNKK